MDGTGEGAERMWTIGTWAALVLSSGIGLSLGLVGGGGSIITLPVLVYVAGIAPREAVALSLAIVGATAAVGGAIQARAGRVHLRAAAVFAAAGMLGAAFGARLTPLVPEPVLMLLFAALMIAVGVRMTRRGKAAEEPDAGACAVGPCGLAGLGVGVLTGFLGVGGGFLIVPALLRFARLPMHRAAATSLVIIAANSASGFAAHLGDLRSSLTVAAAFTAAALAGLLGGIALGRRMRAEGLKLAFGGLALSVAAYLVAVNLGPAAALLAGGR